MVRWLTLILLAIAFAGCGSGARAEAGADQPPSENDPMNVGDDGDLAGARQACVQDSDCEAVATSCCECPTFAVAVEEGFGAVCEDVTCNGQLECSAQEAICSAEYECVLACSQVVCDLSCENGFEVDAAGCAVCACAATPTESECALDEDCVQVAADCCGCSRGGSDTAVPVEQAADFVDALGCVEGASCPEIDTCDPAEAPACVFGKCLLTAMDGAELPLEVCGTADSPTCASGGDCVLNSRDYPEIAAAGVGVCAAP